jgi:hypothetical protein
LNILRILAAASPSFITTRVPPDSNASMALIGKACFSHAARTSLCGKSTLMARDEGMASRIALPELRQLTSKLPDAHQRPEPVVRL